MQPKLDVLIIGVGDVEPTREFSNLILSFMKKYRINVEVLRTDSACATFNFLNAERRMVAALLIPPLHILVSEDDLMLRHSKSNYFELEDGDEATIPKLKLK